MRNGSNLYGIDANPTSRGIWLATEAVTPARKANNGWGNRRADPVTLTLAG